MSEVSSCLPLIHCYNFDALPYILLPPVASPYSAAPVKQLAPAAPSFGTSPFELSDEVLIVDLWSVFHQGQDLSAALSSHSSRHAEVAAKLASVKEANARLKEELAKLMEVAEGDRKALLAAKETVRPLAQCTRLLIKS